MIFFYVQSIFLHTILYACRVCFSDSWSSTSASL